MSNWPLILDFFQNMTEEGVLVTVGEVKGSTPRDIGATMLVTSNRIIGTIGGGRLEYKAVEKARDILNEPEGTGSFQAQFPLGPELAQCCGGHVDILISKVSENELKLFNQYKNINRKCVLVTHWVGNICRRQLVSADDNTHYLDLTLQAAIQRRLQRSGTEIIPSVGLVDTAFNLVQSLDETEFHITLFGAGHVGKAIVAALAPLPCTITWIDDRASEFPDTLPINVTKCISNSPPSEISKSPFGSYFLVMTHSHQLDLEICEAVLESSGESYLGLIGSATKKKKFHKRLAVRGYTDEDIQRITCPIGLKDLYGKRPAEIAVSVAAEILLKVQQRRTISAMENRQDIQA
jgi:xanthine dehydrogenase accessory factor